jgi:glycosyltransferase involved in cell wall biosynthesis
MRRSAAAMSEPAGVLYVIDELLQLGGAERNLVRILRHLPRDRYRPFVLTFRLNPEVKDFRTLPCPVEVYPVYNLYGPDALRYAPRLLRWIRRERIRIVHTFFETADLWAGSVAKLGSDAVLISSRRDLGIQRNWRLNMLYRMLSAMFDQVQVVSDQVGAYVIEADRVAPDKVVTVPNGIELELIPERGSGAELCSRLNLPAGRPVIATVSNIRKVKGIDVLVRTAAEVCRKHPEALFVVAGRVLDAAYQAELELLARELGVLENVRFVGQVEDPLQLLAQSDIFLLPSRSEGMSNALLEAMASSLPAVATGVGGNCQLIQDEKTGFLTPPEDAGAAAARIVELLENPALAHSLGRAARTLIEREYSADAVVELLVRKYERLLDRS